MPKPILCLDFDGVCTTYASGWQGIDICPDPPVEGFELFLDRVLDHFEVHIHSSRSREPEGRAAMRQWCEKWLFRGHVAQLHFPEHKPPAMVTLDDRAITFTGTWPTVPTLLAFQPWTRNTPPPGERPAQEGEA
jgi:hypothetical protein